MKSRPIIIGITGQATAGKTSLAVMLSSLLGDVVRLSFADPIRDMLKALGLNDRDFNEDKNSPHHLLCGRTPRYAMQKLGTEWARNMIGDEIWCRVGMERTRMVCTSGGTVIFDDVRFDNEADAIRKLGGVIIHVSRPGLPPPMEHASERGIAPVLIDHYIHAYDLEDLRGGAAAFVNTHFNP